MRQIEPVVKVQPELEWFEWIDKKTGKKKRQPKWFADAWHLPAENPIRSKNMSNDIMRMVEDGIRDEKIEFLARRVNELENAVNELAKVIPGIIARRERLIRELEGRDMLEVIDGGAKEQENGQKNHIR